MRLSLNIGIVVDFGGILGQANTDSSSDLEDQVSDWNLDESDFDSLVLPITGATALVGLQKTANAVEQIARDTSERSLLNRLALFIGPAINIGPIYLTAGPCIGGFGCFAVGAGINLGRFGIGFLIPIWKWW